jgi:hypothetical protein
MAEIHGNEAWGTVIITSPCSTGLRPAMSAASRPRLPLLFLFLLLRIVGQETVQYVSNIYKYYIAYKLLTDHAAETQKAKQAVTTTP